MKSVPSIAPRTIAEANRDAVADQAHLRAWKAITDTLDEVDPRWANDVTKSPVENAVAAINRLAKRGG